MRFSASFLLFYLLFFIAGLLCTAQNNNGKIASLQKDTLSIGKNISTVTTPNNDSLNSIFLAQEIKFYFKKKDWDAFNNARAVLLKLTTKTKDSAVLAKTLYYSGAYFNKIQKPDSAYFYYLKSFNIYAALKDSVSAGETLLNISILKKNSSDYRGSETDSYKALSFFNEKQDSRQVSSIYNNLGIIYNQLDDKENALKYHTKAMILREELPDKLYYLHSLNNIGKVYRDYGQYNQALASFKQIFLFPDVLKNNASFNAMVLDNYAYALFLQNPKADVEAKLKEAFSLMDSINDYDGQIISAIHLAEFYAEKNNKTKALEYAKFAEKTSRITHNYRDYMESLALMASLYDNEEAKAHFEKYINIRDSLDLSQLKTRESFTRIQYETQLKETENKSLRITQDEQQKIIRAERFQKWAIGSGLAISLAALGVFFIVFRKNQKQKKVIEKQKDLVEKLQRELHHRLKNNLSFIDFFITLAKGKFHDPAYRAKLDELQNRINSMFEVHKQLFKKEDVTSVNAKTYISALVENVKKAYAAPNITLEENVADTNLRADTSFPIGLIVNEFVTNSYKYAFPNNENGIVSINLKEENNQYHLQLADNGKGLPKDFDIDSLNSFGMETIKLLTQEYKGTFALDGTNGTRMDITFPK
ncbi:MAG: tetratricopeptide repeat protein [Flavobacteriaceae bacterium]|nr:tetratricopeptide repeat protein [Flavobacteriaceae bacterium]